MKSTEAQVRHRARPISALKTDEKVLSAAIQLLSKNGIGSTTPAALARQANLSITAIRQRYTSAEDFLYWIWQQKSIPEVITPIFGFISQYLEQKKTDINFYKSELSKIISKTELNRATLEILIVCSFNNSLRTKIQKDFYLFLNWPEDFEPVKATQKIMYLNTILGLISDQKSLKKISDELLELTHQIFISFLKPTKLKKMPNVDASHLDVFKVKVDDPIKERIILNFFECIGKYGFDKTTTKLLAQDSGLSEGLIFSKFKTKLDVFTQAFVASMIYGYKANLKFVENLTEQFGEAMADAILLRESCHPDRNLQRTVYLEQMRLSWHSAEVAKAYDQALRQVFQDWQSENKDVATQGDESAPANQVRVAIPRGAVITSVILPETFELPYISLTENLAV